MYYPGTEGNWYQGWLKSDLQSVTEERPLEFRLNQYDGSDHLQLENWGLQFKERLYAKSRDSRCSLIS